MSQQTVAAFLREKLTNMANWIEEELGKENTRVVLKQYVADRTDTEIATLMVMMRVDYNDSEDGSKSTNLEMTVTMR